MYYWLTPAGLLTSPILYPYKKELPNTAMKILAINQPVYLTFLWKDIKIETDVTTFIKRKFKQLWFIITISARQATISSHKPLETKRPRPLDLFFNFSCGRWYVEEWKNILCFVINRKLVAYPSGRIYRLIL